MAGRECLRDYQFTLERQSTWGTAVDTTAAIILPTPEMFVDLEPGNHVIPMSTGTAYDTEVHVFNDSTTGIAKVTFKVPATPQLNSIFLPALLQKSADYTAASNVWTYIPQTRANLPLPRTSNQGYFYTLTARSPTAGKSIQMKDAVCTSLKRSVHSTDNEKQCYFEVEFIGRGYSHGVTMSATPVAVSLASRYQWIDLDVFTVNAQANITDFVSIETTLSWGAKFQNDVPGGEIVFPKFMTSGKFSICGNANTEALKTLCHTSAVDNAIALLLGWGDTTVNAAGEWLTTEYIYLKKFSSERNDGEIITFDYEGVGGSAAEYPFKSEHYYLAA